MNSVEPLRDRDDIEAMKNYLRNWNERNYMLFLTGISTGFRVSDILTLKVSDVKGWHIRVREKKTGKLKTIKMTKSLKKELRKYIEGKPSDSYLFVSRNGSNKPLDRRTVYWMLKKAGDAVGLSNIGTHTMRKTFGYWYYKKYKNAADLMTLFNHSSQAITLIYIGVRQDDLDYKMSNFDI